MILAIDFDGVIHDREHSLPGKKMGAPMPGAVAGLDALISNGHKIIVHTVMATTQSGADAVADWLEYYNIDVHQITAIKPQADMYIDDKALHFDNWAVTLATIARYE